MTSSQRRSPLPRWTTSRVPSARATRLRTDLERGAYLVRWWADALTESLRVAHARPDLGVTDASLVALAERLNTNRIATFDHHHFRPLTGSDGEPFVLLPADQT